MENCVPFKYSVQNIYKDAFNDNVLLNLYIPISLITYIIPFLIGEATNQTRCLLARETTVIFF